MGRRIIIKSEEEDKKGGNLVIATTSLMLGNIPEVTAANQNCSRKMSLRVMLPTILAYLFTNIALCTILRHNHLSSPLMPHDEFSIGEYRISCGLFQLVPGKCSSMSLLRLDKEGLLTLSNDRGEIMWQMLSNDSSCTSGDMLECNVMLTQGGEVMIGRKLASLVKIGNYPDPRKNTWPFSKEVKMLSKAFDKNQLPFFEFVKRIVIQVFPFRTKTENK